MRFFGRRGRNESCGAVSCQRMGKKSSYRRIHDRVLKRAKSLRTRAVTDGEGVVERKIRDGGPRRRRRCRRSRRRRRERWCWRGRGPVSVSVAGKGGWTGPQVAKTSLVPDTG